MKFSIFLIFSLILKLSSANICWPPYYWDYADVLTNVAYATKFQMDCVAPPWNDHMAEALKKFEVMTDVSQFFVNYGDQMYTEFFSKYSFLSISGQLTSYKSYVNLIRTKVAPMVSQISSLNAALQGANTNFWSFWDVLLLEAMQIITPLQDAVTNNITADETCAYLTKFATFYVFYHMRDLISVNWEFNVDPFTREIASATATWFNLWNLFQTCVKTVGTTYNKPAQTCIVNTAKNFTTNYNSLLKFVNNAATVLTNMKATLPLHYANFLRVLQDNSLIDRADMQAKFTACTGVTLEPIIPLKKKSKVVE